MPRSVFTALIAVCLFHTSVLCAQQADSEQVDDSNVQRRAEIADAISSYVEAFDARDVDALLSHWSPEGSYFNRTTDERFEGHDALREQFELTAQESPNLSLKLFTESIEFVSPNVAVERGTAIVSENLPQQVNSAENTTSTDSEAGTESTQIGESNYSVVFVRHGDKWLIDRVVEEEIQLKTTHYDELQVLEWLIGDWVDEGDGYRVEVSTDWTENSNYIARKYKVFDGEQITSSGLQLIGWDARQKIIRSWLFDSDGGFVLGTWENEDEQWTVNAVATLSDGSAGSYTSVFTPREDGVYEWMKVNRVRDGQLLPNLEKTVFLRR